MLALATLRGGTASGSRREGWHRHHGYREAPVTSAARVSLEQAEAVLCGSRGRAGPGHQLHSLSPQLGPGSPPGVWVCSTDMLLSVPPNPGEPEKAWDCLP